MGPAMCVRLCELYDGLNNLINIELYGCRRMRRMVCCRLLSMVSSYCLHLYFLGAKRGESKIKDLMIPWYAVF